MEEQFMPIELSNIATHTHNRGDIKELEQTFQNLDCNDTFKEIYFDSKGLHTNTSHSKKEFLLGKLSIFGFKNSYKQQQNDAKGEIRKLMDRFEVPQDKIDSLLSSQNTSVVTVGTLKNAIDLIKKNADSKFEQGRTATLAPLESELSGITKVRNGENLENVSERVSRIANKIYSGSSTEKVSEKITKDAHRMNFICGDYNSYKKDFDLKVYSDFLGSDEKALLALSVCTQHTLTPPQFFDTKHRFKLVNSRNTDTVNIFNGKDNCGNDLFNSVPPKQFGSATLEIIKNEHGEPLVKINWPLCFSEIGDHKAAEGEAIRAIITTEFRPKLDEEGKVTVDVKPYQYSFEGRTREDLPYY